MPPLWTNELLPPSIFPQLKYKVAGDSILRLKTV